MLHKLNYDLTDLIFRILFSLIFLGLGMEHLFSDALIQGMMPDWMVYKRAASICAGLILLLGGTSVLLGYKSTEGAVMLGLFLVVVTVLIHLPATLQAPTDLPSDWSWLWDVYQRSNLVKNLCLLGVCFHLINHEHGKYSVDAWLESREGTDA